MTVKENKKLTTDYEAIHANGSAIQIFFKDGTKTSRIEIDFPIGDPSRRQEGIPLLLKKFRNNLSKRFARKQLDLIYNLFLNQDDLESIPVNEFMELLTHSF
jgi:2-methylcitrate dehydratase